MSLITAAGVAHFKGHLRLKVAALRKTLLLRIRSDGKKSLEMTRKAKMIIVLAI